MKKHISFKSLNAGKDSSWSIKSEDGTKSSLGFDSKSDADKYITERTQQGQNPMDQSNNISAYAEYLLNN